MRTFVFLLDCLLWLIAFPAYILACSSWEIHHSIKTRLTSILRRFGWAEYRWDDLLFVAIMNLALIAAEAALIFLIYYIITLL